MHSFILGLALFGRTFQWFCMHWRFGYLSLFIQSRNPLEPRGGIYPQVINPSIRPSQYLASLKAVGQESAINNHLCVCVSLCLHFVMPLFSWIMSQQQRMPKVGWGDWTVGWCTDRILLQRSVHFSLCEYRKTKAAEANNERKVLLSPQVSSATWSCGCIQSFRQTPFGFIMAYPVRLFTDHGHLGIFVSCKFLVLRKGTLRHYHRC